MYCKYLCGLFIRKTEVTPKVSSLNFGVTLFLRLSSFLIFYLLSKNPNPAMAWRKRSM